MGQSKNSKRIPMLDTNKDVGDLQCVGCQEYRSVLYKIFPWAYCYECAEAILRRERFEREEKEWNKKD